jgi:hypothetical protein
MKYLQISLAVLLALAMTSAAKLTTAAAQNQASALERGYRTGYSDGYTSGTRDVADQVARDYQNKEDYQRADRSYNQAWGTLEDYRDGYQQGFEGGYAAGYDRREFDSSIPAGIKTRGTVDAGVNNSPANSPAPAAADNTHTSNQNSNNTASSDNTATVDNSAPVGAAIFIPRDTVLVVELESPLSTDVSQRGDRFQARIVSPQEFSGAMVEGRVSQVKRAGKVKGRSELQLAFETIRTADGRSAALNADVVELVDNGRSDNAGSVDSEGGVKGQSSTKDDVTKVGAAAGVGAIIGAIFGGGQGAAIGAAIGGGVGAGGVLSSRGHDVRLDRGQQMKIRTATEARL